MTRRATRGWRIERLRLPIFGGVIAERFPRCSQATHADFISPRRRARSMRRFGLRGMRPMRWIPPAPGSRSEESPVGRMEHEHSPARSTGSTPSFSSLDRKEGHPPQAPHLPQRLFFRPEGAVGRIHRFDRSTAGGGVHRRKEKGPTCCPACRPGHFLARLRGTIRRKAFLSSGRACDRRGHDEE